MVKLNTRHLPISRIFLDELSRNITGNRKHQRSAIMSTETNLCPCGSDLPFSSCCNIILEDHSKAKTAEQLMRSRYTAFIKKHDKHILCSWDDKNRPKALNHEEHPVTWLNLTVDECKNGGEHDLTGTVQFTASYIENGQLSHLKELSTFNKKDGLWFYANGQCTVEKEKIARNSPCPCGSGKKFKRCCYGL